MSEDDRCVVCGDPRQEWPTEVVLIGELTRHEVNRDLDERGEGPLCGRHECKHERSDVLLDLYGTLSKAARFGGPGYNEL